MSAREIGVWNETTYGAAPKALFFVSERIAANVLVITATNKLINQKFNTTTQRMKKKHETKNSASIMEYIIGAHCKIKAKRQQS
jgi:hypothetical protein